jgi:hypothetical protein
VAALLAPPLQPAFAKSPSSRAERQLLELIARKNVGRVAFLEGEVLVDGRRVSGSVPLYVGSVVETGLGYATLAFGADNLVDLDVGTRFRVVQLKRTRSPGAALRIGGMLDRGRLKGTRAELPGRTSEDRIQVITPVGKLSIEGGRYLVEVPARETKGGRVKLMSVDQPAQMVLIAPADVVDESILEATSEVAHRRADFFPTVDVDGGDAITGTFRLMGPGRGPASIAEKPNAPPCAPEVSENEGRESSEEEEVSCSLSTFHKRSMAALGRLRGGTV